MVAETLNADFGLLQQIINGFTMFEITGIFGIVLSLLITFAIIRTEDWKGLLFPVALSLHASGLTINYFYLSLTGLLFIFDAIDYRYVVSGIKAVSTSVSSPKALSTYGEKKIFKPIVQSLAKKTDYYDKERAKQIKGVRSKLMKERYDSNLENQLKQSIFPSVDSMFPNLKKDESSKKPKEMKPLKDKKDYLEEMEVIQ